MQHRDDTGSLNVFGVVDVVDGLGGLHHVELCVDADVLGVFDIVGFKFLIEPTKNVDSLTFAAGRAANI